VINPGAIPQFQGDVDTLDGDASTLRTAGQSIRDTGADVHATWQGLSAFYDAPEAATLFAATEPVRTSADELAGDVRSVAGTLSAYAAEVRPVAEQLRQLQADAYEFVAAAGADDDWRKDGDKVNQHNELLTAVDAQVLALMEAERRAANAINALNGGTQWHAGDSSTDPNAYGPAEIPSDAERPWGTPEEKDEPWWKDALNGAKSLVWDGIVVDGLWGDVKGLFGLINPFDWDTFSQSWSALWTLTGKWFYDPGEAAEAWKHLGRSLLAWDMWAEDPARAFGSVLYNVVTIPIGWSKAFKAGKGGGLADDAADAAGDAGRAADAASAAAVTRVLDELASSGRVHTDLPTVGDLAARLDDTVPDVRVEGLDTAAGRAEDLATATARADDAATAGAHTADDAGQAAGDAGRTADDAGSTADDAGGAGDDLPARDPEREPALVGGREAEEGAGVADDAGRAGDGPGDHGDGGSGDHGDGPGDRAGDGGDHGGGNGDGPGDGPRSGDAPDGGWFYRDENGNTLRLDPAANAAADAYLQQARTAEEHVSAAMRDIQGEVDGANLQGWDHRLKTEESLKRKLATALLEDPTLSFDEVLSGLKDSVRYTVELPEGRYAAGALETAELMHARGFELVGEPRNTWGRSGYQGINSVWRDPDTGQLFEVQFHTPTSFWAKETTHLLYEKERLPGTPPEEAARLAAEQQEIFSRVTVPPGAEDVVFSGVG
jgi:hypothetical protein